MSPSKLQLMGVLSLVFGAIQSYLAYAGLGNRTVHLWLAGIFLVGGAYVLLGRRKNDK